MKKQFSVAIFVMTIIAGTLTSQPVRSQDQITSALLNHLSCFPLELRLFEKQEPIISKKEFCLATIYNEIGMQPLWVTLKGPTEQARILLSFLQNADKEGLDPKDYDIDAITKLQHSLDPQDLARFDTLLTYNIVKYIHDISHGRIRPYQSDVRHFPEAGDKKFDPFTAIEFLRNSSDLKSYIEGLPPSHQHYKSLKTALARYEKINKSGGWPKIPDGKTLRPGMESERVPIFRQRLSLETGRDIQPESAPFLYDELLVEEIKDFQRLHGLEIDGIIGRETMGALNKSCSYAIQQIMLNMARWRWQAHDLGKRYVLINIAHFDLALYSGEDIELQMAVIVGKQQHQTPVFSDTIKYIDLNPYWNVPSSIAVKEDLPKLREDPYYLVNKRVRLFSSWEEDAQELDSTTIDWRFISGREMSRYHLRQDPGPWNALGSIKFVFPNQYGIYIHDTPTQDLFDHTKRDFSHGCIRISKPLLLAEAVLRDNSNGWTIEHISQTIQNGTRQVIRLSMPLPVHITYQTVWVDKNEEVYFIKDVYGRDKRLRKVLYGYDVFQ